MATVSGKNSDKADSQLSKKEITLENTIYSNVENCNEKNSVGIDLSITSNSDSCLNEFNNSSEFTFDNVIGHLEDMLIDEDFHKLQSSFLEKYWEEFEDTEESKHSYMPIFDEYTNEIEEFITLYLEKRIKNFEMEKFITELEGKKDNLEGEIFEVLLTLSDFRAFKEIFLDYRAMKEGRSVDLGESLSVSSVTL